MQTLPSKVPGGTGLTSNYLPGGLALNVLSGSFPIFSGIGYGFIIESLGGIIPSVIAIEVRSPNQKTSNIGYFTVNKWYDLPFSKLTIVTAPGVTTYTGYTGALAINVATQPFTFVRPVAPAPAQSSGNGGLGTMSTAVEVSALTRAAPTSPLEGVGITLLGETFLSVVIKCAENQTIDGGVIDIWYYDGTLSLWMIALQGVPIPTGYYIAQVPFSTQLMLNIGVRNVGDLFLAATNGVTLSGGSTVTVYTRIQ